MRPITLALLIGMASPCLGASPSQLNKKDDAQVRKSLQDLSQAVESLAQAVVDMSKRKGQGVEEEVGKSLASLKQKVDQATDNLNENSQKARENLAEVLGQTSEALKDLKGRLEDQ